MDKRQNKKPDFKAFAVRVGQGQSDVKKRLAELPTYSQLQRRLTDAQRARAQFVMEQALLAYRHGGRKAMEQVLDKLIP